MAYVPLQPANVSASLQSTDTLKSLRVGPVRSLTGTIIDLSAWDSFTAKAISKTAYMSKTFEQQFSIASAQISGNADGTLDIEFRIGDLASFAIQGTHEFAVQGKAVSGDPDQVVASGTLSLGV